VCSSSITAHRIQHRKAAARDRFVRSAGADLAGDASVFAGKPTEQSPSPDGRAPGVPRPGRRVDMLRAAGPSFSAVASGPLLTRFGSILLKKFKYRADVLFIGYSCQACFQAEQ